MTKIIVVILLLAGFSIVGYWVTTQQPVSTLEPPPAPRKPRIERAGAVVYLDVSASVAGFFRASNLPGTAIQRALWGEIVPALRARLPKESVSFATFGGAVRPPEELGPAESLLGRLRFESNKARAQFFADTETKLVELFQTKAMTEARMFVVVTDGIPSTPGQGGVDPRLVTVLKSLVDAGLRLWLIGARVSFDGRVYPETPNAFGAKKPFRYHGLRPIYVWVGTHESKIGADVVAAFASAIRSYLDHADEGLVRTVMLSAAEPVRATIKLNTKGVEGVLALEGDGHTVLRVANGVEGMVRIPLDVRWPTNDRPGPPPDELEWIVLPSRKERVSVVTKGGHWELQFDVQRVSVIDLELRLRPKETRWWIDWGTRDDSAPSNADRTLYLGALIESLRIKPKPYTVARASFRIE